MLADMIFYRTIFLAVVQKSRHLTLAKHDSSRYSALASLRHLVKSFVFT
jgi:hypothetical protein